MKKISVSIPDNVYRDARIHADQSGRSISALVAEYLHSLSARATDVTRLAAQQRQVQSEIRQFSARERLDRESIHRREVR